MAAGDGDARRPAHRRPPASTRAMVSGASTLIGIFTRARNRIGVPLLAYTSLKALLAAMRPKSWGSSTMGMK